MKAVYVVLSRTGTILSRIISKITGDWYTHASLSLDDDLQTMYSFGRLWAYNPWIGGFVKESTAFGTMRRFCQSDAVVMRILVSEEKYKAIEQTLTTMYAERRKYHYNYWGLFLSRWKVRVHRKKHFYCSEFVNEFLECFNLIQKGEFGKVVRPMDLLKLQQTGKGTVIYRGALCQFLPGEI